MSSDSKPKLYLFEESVWANVPKIAITEAGFKDDEFEIISINLAEGKNFDPEYLKVNHNGTVPTLIWDGKTFDDSTTVVSEIVKRAPHPPRVSAHASTSIIEEVHAAAHDPNATLLIATSDQDRQDKINGIVKGFLEGRQKALDEFTPKAPEEFKKFLEKKQAENKGLLGFYAEDPDEHARKEMYAQGEELWKSCGIVIRGVITQAISKTPGPYAGGEKPSEVDFHIITWLARTMSNCGVAPGSPSSGAIPKLKEKTGGHGFDPIVGKYWDAWTQRESFKKNNVH